jgi:hypothetical protein
MIRCIPITVKVDLAAIACCWRVRLDIGEVILFNTLGG